jgi:hypothetical protein
LSCISGTTAAEAVLELQQWILGESIDDGYR